MKKFLNSLFKFFYWAGMSALVSFLLAVLAAWLTNGQFSESGAYAMLFVGGFLTGSTLFFFRHD